MSTINHTQQNKRRFFAYLRVSTPKQGERVSLITQREAIAWFAAKRGFLIAGWFEEKETAAKRGSVEADVFHVLTRSKIIDEYVAFDHRACR